MISPVLTQGMSLRERGLGMEGGKEGGRERRREGGREGRRNEGIGGRMIGKEIKIDINLLYLSYLCRCYNSQCLFPKWEMV